MQEINYKIIDSSATIDFVGVAKTGLSRRSVRDNAAAAREQAAGLPAAPQKGVAPLLGHRAAAAAAAQGIGFRRQGLGFCRQDSDSGEGLDGEIFRNNMHSTYA